MTQEEPKQETLEEAAEKRYGTLITNPKKNITVDIHGDLKIGFVEGAKSDAAKDYWYAKWQQERSYSEEDLVQLLNFVSREYNISNGIGWFHTHESNEDVTSKEVLDKWFEQFKKK
jgi:hypothetical protein